MKSQPGLERRFPCFLIESRPIGDVESIKGGQMAKGYWVVAYRSVSNEAVLKHYGELAGPAIAAGGGKMIIRTADAIEPRESGLKQRTVVTEFESFEKALATYNSPAYEAARKVLGSAADRDFRIVEGIS